MSASVPIFNRRWFRVAHWSAAVGALAACIYLFAASPGPSHSPLMIGSSAAILWSLLAFRRHRWVIANVLVALAGILLTWSIVAFVQAN